MGRQFPPDRPEDQARGFSLTALINVLQDVVRGLNQVGQYIAAIPGVSGALTVSGILTTQSGRVLKLRVHTAAGAATVVSSDDTLVINKTVGAATTCNLPASPATGQRHLIKDGKGDAGVNNITVTPAAGTIDGAATQLISSNYAAIEVQYNGTEWNVTGRY